MRHRSATQRSWSATSSSGSLAPFSGSHDLCCRVPDSGEADQPADADKTCCQQHSDAEAVKVELNAGAARNSDADDRDSEHAGDPCDRVVDAGGDPAVAAPGV